MLNYAGVSALTPAELSARASRVLRFIDLGGHQRYLKTALYGEQLLGSTSVGCGRTQIWCPLLEHFSVSCVNLYIVIEVVPRP